MNHQDLRRKCIDAGCRACDAMIIDPEDPLATDAVRRVPAIVDAVLAVMTVAEERRTAARRTYNPLELLLAADRRRGGDRRWPSFRPPLALAR